MKKRQTSHGRPGLNAVLAFTALSVTVSIGCSSGTDSREDFRRVQTAASESPSSNSEDPSIPPLMVGQTYAITTKATKESPAKKYTGTVKSVDGSDVVLNSPVTETTIPSDAGGAQVVENGLSKSLDKEVTIKTGTIAQLQMVFSTVP